MQKYCQFCGILPKICLHAFYAFMKLYKREILNCHQHYSYFFCKVMIQIGPLYMYKDLLFFASSALLWYLFCWNHPSLDLKVQILFLKPRSLLLPKNTNPSPSVDAWNRITSALINKSGKLSRRRKKSRTHTDRCVLVSCSTSLKKS